MNEKDIIPAIIAAYIACGCVKIAAAPLDERWRIILEGKILSRVMLWTLTGMQDATFTPLSIISRVSSMPFQMASAKRLLLSFLVALPPFIVFFCFYLYLRSLDINIWLFWAIAPVYMTLSMVPIINIFGMLIFFVFYLCMSLLWIFWKPIMFLFLPKNKTQTL